jgi:hypothetical protein
VNRGRAEQRGYLMWLYLNELSTPMVVGPVKGKQVLSLTQQ